MKPTKKYSDVIGLPRHVSPRRPPMPLEDRAAQFAPFAALTGFDGVIRETARLTEGFAELTEDEIALLDEKLREIADHMESCPRVTVTWFRPDGRKKGGAYVSTTGNVEKMDLYTGKICLQDGTQIPICRIRAITQAP